MLIVHVFVHVKPESVDDFMAASRSIQQADDPTRFVLVEVYRDADAPVRHKETAHYAQWRDTVAEMMAEPRSSVKYANLFPDDAGWG